MLTERQHGFTGRILWKCMAPMGKPRKKHPEDEQLEAFFKRNQIEIERLHATAIAAEAIGGAPLPGIALHGYFHNDDIDDQGMWPLSVICCDEIKDADHLFEMLNHDRMNSENEYEISIWIFALPLPGNPLVCLGSTEGGARFVRVRVEYQWLVSKDDKVLPHIALDEITRDEEYDTRPGSMALGTVLMAIGTLFDLDPSELNEKLTPDFKDQISNGLNLAAAPYFHLTLGALQYAQIIKEAVTSSVREERERAEHLESLHRKATNELSTVKKHLASTLNAQQRRATSPPPPQEKPQASTGSTKAHEPTALANRLGAFF